MVRLFDHLYARARALVYPTYIECGEAEIDFSGGYLSEGDFQRFLEEFESNLRFSLLGPSDKRHQIALDRVAEVSRHQKSESTFRILDVGGGSSPLMPENDTGIKVKFRVDILEQESVVSLLKGTKFSSTNGTVFSLVSREDANDQEYNFVYFGTSLQYFQDWQGILERVASQRNARDLVISDTPVSLGRTQSAVQTNLGSSKIPLTLISRNDLCAKLASLGFKLILEQSHGTKFHRHRSLNSKQWEFWTGSFSRFVP